MLLFFASIVLHELGHALAARREGITTNAIDLWFFGGIAKMSRDTDSPGAEFKIAAAGPAVTLVICAICVGLGAALADGAALDVMLLNDDVAGVAGVALLGFLALWNGALLVFNLIPAFPLDGGRLHARGRLGGDRRPQPRDAARRAHRRVLRLPARSASASSSPPAASPFDGIYLAIVGWFLAQGARAAIASTAFTERIDGITVADIMDAEPVTMPATTTVLRAQDEFFLRYRWEWFPVVDERGRFVGVVSEQRIDDGDRGRAPGARGRPSSSRRPRPSAGACRRTARWSRCSATSTCARNGALMAVDADGVLRGVVTIEQVRRALSAALPQRLA